MQTTATTSSKKSTLSPTVMRNLRIASMLKATISGIPCLIEVNDCIVVKGSYNRMCDSSDDYYGWSDVSFTVYDRKGYKAEWLERKMTDNEREDIEQMIIESQSDDGDY